MSNLNITGGDGIQGFITQGIPSAGGASAELAMAYLYSSTVLPSSQTSQDYNPVAGIPSLAPPTYTDVAIIVENKTAQIAEDVLNAWADSIAKQAQQTKEWLNSMGYQLWLETYDPTVIAQQANNAQSNHLSAADQNIFISSLPVEMQIQFILPDPAQSMVWLEGLSSVLSNAAKDVQGYYGSGSTNASQAVDPAARNQAVGPSQFVISSLMVGLAAVPLFQAIPAVGHTSQVEARILQDAWNAINPDTTALTITQIGGWFSALWGIGLAYQLSAQNIDAYSQGQGNSPEKDINFAKTYAEELVASLNTSQFEVNLLALVAAASQSTSEAQQQDPQTLLIKGKLLLLAMSLALLAKLEVKSSADQGWITGEEFGALLSGKADYTSNDPWQLANTKTLLLGQINNLLNQLDPAEKEQLLYNLIGFIDTNPSVENMLDQQNVFYSVLGPTNFEQENFDKKPL